MLQNSVQLPHIVTVCYKRVQFPHRMLQNSAQFPHRTLQNSAQFPHRMLQNWTVSSQDATKQCTVSSQYATKQCSFLTGCYKTVHKFLTGRYKTVHNFRVDPLFKLQLCDKQMMRRLKKKKKNEKKREKKQYNMKHTKSTSFLTQKICSGPTLIQDCPFHSQDCITRIMAKNVHVAIKVTKS